MSIYSAVKKKKGGFSSRVNRSAPVLSESSVFRLEFCAFHRGRHLGKSGRPVIYVAGLDDEVLRVLGNRRAGEIHSGPRDQGSSAC